MLRLKAVSDKRPFSVNLADIMALNLQLKKTETFFINTVFPTNIFVCCHSLNPLVRDTI